MLGEPGFEEFDKAGHLQRRGFVAWVEVKGSVGLFDSCLFTWKQRVWFVEIQRAVSWA